MAGSCVHTGGWWAEGLRSFSARGRVCFLWFSHNVPWTLEAGFREGREDSGTDDQVVRDLGTPRAAVLLSV